MAVREKHPTLAEGTPCSERAGSVRTRATVAASACHSFWELEGGGAGAKGAEGWDDWAQHTGLAQDFAHLNLQQLRATRVPSEWLPPDSSKTHAHPRTNPSRRTTAVSSRRDRKSTRLNSSHTV